MPVLKEWYEVEKLLSRKSIAGVFHYLVKWKNYRRSSWEPYYNIGQDLLRQFEGERYERQVAQRQQRYNKRCFKMETGLDYDEIPIPGRPPKPKKW